MKRKITEAQLQKAHDKAMAQARKDYDEAIAKLTKVYDEALVQAWAEFGKAEALLIDRFRQAQRDLIMPTAPSAEK